MADNLQEYSVSVEFDNAVSKIRKFSAAASKMNKNNENSLLRQIQYQRRLNALKGAGLSGLGGVPKSPTTPSTPKPKTPAPSASGAKPYKADAHVKALKVEQKRIAALSDMQDKLKGNVLWLKKDLTLSEQSTKATIERRIGLAKNAKEMNRIVSQEMKSLTLNSKNTAQLKKQNFLMQRMSSSSKQFAGNMVSAFAIAAGGSVITRVGQDFESVRNTMLAVSADAETAGENFGFVQSEAFRLGLGLTEAAKGFAKMNAARGEMSLEDTKKAFTGISEMSTLLGLKAEESNRAINALQQMMSKGVVSAEELKLQMGEVLPNAIPLMAKAAQDAGLSVSGTVKEMMELQQTGDLISSQVLPHFAKSMSDAARANGGLENALKSNRVAMNKMFTSFQMASDSFFKSGFSEGLTELFTSMADMVKGNEVLWKSLGKIAGSVLKGLSWIVKNLVNPVLSAFGSILNALTDLFGNFSAILTGVFGSLVQKLLPQAISQFSMMRIGMNLLMGAARALLLPFTLILGVLEEIAEFFSPTGKETLLGINITDITEEVEALKQSFSDMFSVQNKVSSGGYTQRSSQDYVTPYLSAGGYGNQREAPTPIVVNSTLQVDGETIAEAAVKTTTMDTYVDRALAAGMVGSR